MSSIKHVGVFDLIIRVGRSNALAAVTTVLIGVITARWLGPSGRGSYALFTTTVSLVSTVSLMGFYHAGVYFVSNKKASTSEALGGVILLAIGNLVVLPAFALVFPSLLGFGHGGVGNALTIVAFVLACEFVLVREGLGGIVMAEKRYGIYTDQLIFEPVLILCLTFLLLLIAKSAETAIYLRTAASALAIMLMIWRIAREQPLRPVFNLQMFWLEVRFGVQAVAQSAITLLNFRVYLYILAVYSQKEAGWYSIALLFCEVVRFVPNAVGSALFPFLTARNAQEANDLAATATRSMLAAGLVVAMVFGLVSNGATDLIFGKAFRPAAFASALMVWGAVAGLPYQTLVPYFTAAGRQGVVIAASSVGLAIGLIIGAIVFPRFGINGAGMSYLVSSVTISAIVIWRFVKMTGLSAATLLVLRRVEVDKVVSMAGRYVSRAV